MKGGDMNVYISRSNSGNPAIVETLERFLKINGNVLKASVPYSDDNIKSSDYLIIVPPVKKAYSANGTVFTLGKGQTTELFAFLARRPKYNIFIFDGISFYSFGYYCNLEEDWKTRFVEITADSLLSYEYMKTRLGILDQEEFDSVFYDTAKDEFSSNHVFQLGCARFLKLI